MVTVVGILEYTAPDPQVDSQMTNAEEEANQMMQYIPGADSLPHIHALTLRKNLEIN